ncbi:MAG: MotA/TolQ/ExbB proton channel family protein [Alphaproteobacteria bacterium]|nr:MotA/TolQ/ExbB proton channel family protein [Alphaproteobacteria bacterium]
MAEGTDDLDLPGARAGIDLATLAGLAGAFVLIVAAMAMGGSPLAFVDLPSVLIVIGGTLSVTTVCFTLPEMGRAVRVAAAAMFLSVRDPSRAALRLINLSERARRNGVLSLQDVQRDLHDDPFLHKGVGMIVDGLPVEEIEPILTQDIQSTHARHQRAVSVLRKAAEVSPAMGLIGTLIGLVQMLSNLNDPTTIGPSMAVALLTTFYGAILAYMVFSPLAAKLERNSGDETLVDQIQLIGLLSIGRQENPRRLEMLLNSVLPPSKRVHYYD